MQLNGSSSSRGGADDIKFAELHCWNGAGGGVGGWVGAVGGRVVERVAVDAGLNLQSSGESITMEWRTVGPGPGEAFAHGAGCVW